MSDRVQRRLTTILAADAEGYSRVMDADEVRGLDALRAARGVFSKFIERHGGRIANTAGDGLIAEFPSVVEAVQCAIEVQRELGGRKRARDSALRFRIGVHLGDVMVDGGDLFGESVNLAARLQAMAEPGGVLISRQVYDQVHAKLSVGFEYLGEKRPKNFAEDVAVYRVTLDKKRRATAAAAPAAADDAPKARPPAKPKRAAPPAANPRERVIRRAQYFGAIWAALVVIDVATGDSFWAHWPGLVMATSLGLEAAPLLVHGWIKLQYARGAVIVAALVLINLFSWSGNFWALWPAGAIIVVELIRWLKARAG